MCVHDMAIAVAVSDVRMVNLHKIGSSPLRMRKGLMSSMGSAGGTRTTSVASIDSLGVGFHGLMTSGTG